MSAIRLLKIVLGQAMALSLAVQCQSQAKATEHFTGLDFVRACAPFELDPDPEITADQQIAQGRCLGYIEGITDANELIRGVRGDNHAFFCVPHDVTFKVRVQTALIFILQEPKVQTMGAYAGIVAALRKAYPCKP